MTNKIPKYGTIEIWFPTTDFIFNDQGYTSECISSTSYIFSNISTNQALGKISLTVIVEALNYVFFITNIRNPKVNITSPYQYKILTYDESYNSMDENKTTGIGYAPECIAPCYECRRSDSLYSNCT